MKSLWLTSTDKKINGIVVLGGSKSISNRLLIMQALSGADFQLSNLSESNDTNCLKNYLSHIETSEKSSIPLIIDAGNAGTVVRFLTAYLSIKNGKWLITGAERMLKRPIGDMVKPLSQLGASISYTEETEFPPLRITGMKFPGGVVQINASVSSQFVSALMMIGPCLKDGLRINFEQKPVSFPYIKMTYSLMKQAGILIEMDEKYILISPGEYKSRIFEIEPDWSSASYWYEIVALSQNGEIFLKGLQRESIQGDSAVAEIFRQLGVTTEYESLGIRLKKSDNQTNRLVYDFTDCPDLVPAVMVTCAAKGIPALFKGVGHLQFKESDRMESLKTELAKIGSVIVKNGEDYELSAKTAHFTDLHFATYSDHRIAMSLAPLVSQFGSINLTDPGVVNKSYSAYWDDLQQLKVCAILEN